MVFKKKILLFTLLISLVSSGCTYFSSKLENIISENDESFASKNKPLRKNYCSTQSSIQIISEDENTLKLYRKLKNEIFENSQIDFIRKSIMLTLIQLSKRPDEISPHSRFQFYLKLNNQFYYYDFRPTNLSNPDQMSLIAALDFMNQKFSSKDSLSSIAQSLDKVVPPLLNVSEGLEQFLKENKNELMKSAPIVNQFFKGDEILTRFEQFERNKYSDLINYYTKNKKTFSNLSDKNSLIPQSVSTNIKCNVSISKTHQNTRIIHFNKLQKSHSLGFIEGDNVFLGTASTILSQPLAVDTKTLYLKGSPPPTPIPICEFINDQNHTVLFSSNDRTPEQHLEHLFSYGLESATRSDEVSELLSFSRHLFLPNPDRILYESKRGRKEQLNLFLTMHFPIYHVEMLGDIFGYGQFFKSKSPQTLFIDDRHSNLIWCQP